MRRPAAIALTYCAVSADGYSGLSAYMFFSQEERPRMKEENPDASFGELGKLLGAAWKELDETDRCVRRARAAH